MKKKRKKKEFSIVFLSTESTKGKKEKKYPLHKMENWITASTKTALDRCRK